MEITGTGGILLLVVAVLWLGFMTPSGKSGLGDATRRRRRVDRVVIQTRAADKQKIQVKTKQNPWYLADVEGVEKIKPVEEIQSTRVEVNRLPDPLSARLGKIENVQWAEVREINQAREVKENLTAESLDEILQRRRSNG
ncbi:MAG: hypothetical protein RLZZ606_580 [Actinomycetota bacterium]|jgi:hypothetical protein